ncbi:MAG: hypothetical protein IJN43_13835 [Ruminococcus sp.]|nr:hypothetical protein [Ruminococcus sp.]
MLDTEAMVDLAFELRATEKRIAGLYVALKDEKAKKEELLKQMDMVVDDAVEKARKGE